MSTSDLALPPAGPDRLLALLDRGDLIRNDWTDGHERMCALAALSDEVRDAENASACPAALMPPWLAELVPDLDDRISTEGWEGRMRRLGESARGWSAIDGGAWERVRLAVLLCLLDIAEESITVDEWGVCDALHGVREALQGRGDLAAARAAAEAAAKTAAKAAEDTPGAGGAGGAARGAYTAAYAAAYAAAYSAYYASIDAAAEGVAWDRICDILLDAIDMEVHHAND
jgi:hypothetical protein